MKYFNPSWIISVHAHTCCLIKEVFPLGNALAENCFINYCSFFPPDMWKQYVKVPGRDVT